LFHLEQNAMAPCIKMVKTSARHLLLFESNKQFKIGSYFLATL
jgi:hypothetical protein